MLTPSTLSVRFKLTFTIYLVFPLWVLYSLESQRKHNFMKTMEMKQLQMRNIRQLLDLKGKEDDQRRMLLSAAAHDLRTPVCAVATSSKLLSSILAQQIIDTEQKDKAERVLSVVKVAVQIGLGTVDNLLTSSQLLSGETICPVLGTCHVRNIVNSCLLLTCEAYLSDQFQCSSSIAQDVPDTIISDQAWIQQMLMNLLSNAFKYTQVGSVTLTVEIAPPSYLAKFKCARQATPLMQNAILFMVEDTGIGVPNEKRHKLFQEVTQASFNGTGIGLYTTGEKAVSLGGSCGYFSHAHGGSVFWFTVPITESVDDSQLPPIGNPQTSHSGHMEITQVEDDAAESEHPAEGVYVINNQFIEASTGVAV